MSKKSILSEADKQRIISQKEIVHQRKKEIVEGLPHLYGFKHYTWSRQFFESHNKMNLLCAGNQLSKSSTQIRKCIEWATNPKLWKVLWPGRTPRIFWYFYPSIDVAKVEVEKKWIPEFLPRGRYKDDMVRGWRLDATKRETNAIHFNSGISVYFKYYSQEAINLQSSTVDAIFTDEEIPVDYYNELLARTFASDGYFHMVFTATLGQELWQRAIEGVGDKEMFKDAFKLQVSMYDCQFYEDGSPGAYDLEKIKRVEEKCTSEAEIQKRVHGKFIADSGRKYYAYSASRHYMKKFPIPVDWKLYGGVDIGSGGSGGKDAHPGAICFVAVRPDYQFGVVYRAWRGDSEATTAGDILNRFIELRDQDQLTLQIFDQNAKDFGTIAGRIGESFCKAEKSHEIGEQVVNTLFKNDMIMLFDDDPEIAKLGSELQSLQKSTPKNRAKDDLADAFRYAVVKIPWDFSIAKSAVEIKAPALPLYDRPIAELSSAELRELEIMERRGLVPRASGHSKDTWEETEEEFDFWNESYGN